VSPLKDKSFALETLISFLALFHLFRASFVGLEVSFYISLDAAVFALASFLYPAFAVLFPAPVMDFIVVDHAFADALC